MCLIVWWRRHTGSKNTFQHIRYTQRDNQQQKYITYINRSQDADRNSRRKLNTIEPLGIPSLIPICFGIVRRASAPLLAKTNAKTKPKPPKLCRNLHDEIVLPKMNTLRVIIRFLVGDNVWEWFLFFFYILNKLPIIIVWRIHDHIFTVAHSECTSSAWFDYTYGRSLYRERNE